MSRKTVKVSAILDVGLHARLSAAAALRGTTKNAILVDALTDKLRGIVAFDRGRKSDSGKKEDRLEPVSHVEDSAIDAA